MAEALGAQGRELLQFIGMGEGIQPHIDPLPRNNNIFIITSDGVHYIEPKIFDSVIINSGNMRQMAERLSALSRWCGGQDNSTLAAVDISEVKNKIFQEGRKQIGFWDFFGQLSIPDDAFFLKSRKGVLKEENESIDSEGKNYNKKKSVKKMERGKGVAASKEKDGKVQLDIKLDEEGGENGKGDS